jgi:hypothetical protein
VDNSVGTVHKRLILVPGVKADHSEGSHVLVFDMTPDKLAGSRTAQIPRAPVNLSGVPTIHNSLLEGIVFPQAGVAYLGERRDEHGHGVGAQRGQVVGVEALSIFHAVYVGACYQGIGVHHVYGKDGDETGEKGTEREAVAPGTQHGEDEPE